LFALVTFPLFGTYYLKPAGYQVILDCNFSGCFMTEKEYNECVTSYADNVYRFILKNLRHEEDARDVVQTAFEKMWRNRQDVDAQKSKSYLFTVAYHQMIDHIRKVKRIQLREEFNDDARVQNKPAHNLKKVLEEALARLSETQRSLVLLKDYEGYSYEEIGQITGLNESQVKVYLHRARVQLKEYLVKMENVI
jgi:RNA polymerase sigma factor (sigma-70 family)